MALLFLTGCKVNWFDKTVDVPWYYVAIPVTLVSIFAYTYLIKGTYVCPKCGKEFKVKWYQMSVCIHINGKRLAKCPNCKMDSFCKRK